MRNCPVCENRKRRFIWSMNYQIPDNWPLPDRIDWHQCEECGMLYGDGPFDAPMLAEYYKKYYGYGVNSPDNIERLKRDAGWISETYDTTSLIVDFGGGDGIIQEELEKMAFSNVHTVHVGEPIPDNAELIYASHVLEHIYDLPDAMRRIVNALAMNMGTLIMDGPDTTGLLQRWGMPILDFNTKHINHFRLMDYLRLGDEWGLELTALKRYELQNAPAYQLHFSNALDVGGQSARHVKDSISARVAKLKKIKGPVNVWGMGDVTWHLLSHVKLWVLDYIDNDPAYRGATYQGKPVLERPTNDAPIVIMAQGQRKALIQNIRAAGVGNEIIEI